MNLIFAVKQRNLDVLQETFWAVSDPKNSRYGQHLSLEQMTELIGPTQQTVDTIVNWLENEGCSDIRITQSREYIHTRVSVPLAARLLNIQFHTYRHLSGISVEASVGPYSLPTSIAAHIDLVSGAVGFPDVRAPIVQVAPPNSGVGSLEIDPTNIRTRYNVTSTTVGTNSKNMHAVAEFQAQYYSPTDLKTFWNEFVPFAAFQPVAKVIGYNNALKPGIEASLDIQYVMGVAPNITTWFYSMKNFNFWEDLMTWVNEINNETNPPFVHSVSYGSQGDYPSDSYRDRLNADFQKLGTRGITIIFASGDSGAGCQGRGLDDQIACDCTFYPSFPATCPYVLTVGATKFLSGNSGPEGAVTYFKSGGGFSQLFPVPSYQSTAVKGYLASGVKMPQPCAFNSTNRATPDVSALGDVHFQVVNGGSVTSVGGTSASAPTFGAIVALLNDIRLNKKQSTFGFINLWIYSTAAQNPSAFFDVTVGDNTTPDCCTSGNLGGFECSAGWDPVTGVGTPNFRVLSTLA